MTANKQARLAFTAISDKLVDIRDKYELAIKKKKRVSLEDTLMYDEACLLIAKGWLDDSCLYPDDSKADDEREIIERSKKLNKLTKNELVLRLAEIELRENQERLRQQWEGDPLFDFYEQFFKNSQKKKEATSASKQKKLDKFQHHTQKQNKARLILTEMSKTKPLVRTDFKEFCKKMRANLLPLEVPPSPRTLRNYFTKFTGFASTK